MMPFPILGLIKLGTGILQFALACLFKIPFHTMPPRARSVGGGNYKRSRLTYRWGEIRDKFRYQPTDVSRLNR
jgi:hypothetical protein